MSDDQHDEGQEDLYPLSTICEFPVGTFLENIAVRRSGELLLTAHNKNELIMLDPNDHNPAPISIHVFDKSVSGIVEMGEDQFYISSGTIGEAGSWSVYHVDMSGFDSSSSSSSSSPSPAITQKLIDIPSALFLNGSAALNSNNSTIILADSYLGTIYRVDVKQAKLSLWLSDEAFQKTSSNPLFPGINGIKCHNGAVHVSNTDAKTFLRVNTTTSSDGGEVTAGEVELLERNLNVDDFAFSSTGSVYLTTHVYQSVVKLDLSSDGGNSTRTRIAGGPTSALVAGTTAAAFGRTERDLMCLYVTTNGGMSLPVDGKVGPARVLRIEVGEVGDFGS